MIKTNNIFKIFLGLSISYSLFGANYINYKVENGDSLYGIAFSHGMSASEFLKLNNIEDADKYNLKIGETLKVKEKEYSLVFDLVNKSYAFDVDKSKSYKNYKVKSGDTILGIAFSHGMSASEFCAINNIKDFNKYNLKVGETLKVANNNIEKETIILAKTKISSLDITIGDNIIYEVKIISKKEIDYEFEDISFDERASQTRIIEVENETKNIGNYKERIIKYRIGFYDIGRFVIFPFKISYEYNNQYKELNGDDINILVNSFSDGEILPPLKSTLSIPMTKYFFIIILGTFCLYIRLI